MLQPLLSLVVGSVSFCHRRSRNLIPTGAKHQMRNSLLTAEDSRYRCGGVMLGLTEIEQARS